MNSGFDGTNLSCPVIMEQQQQELHIISNMIVAESFLRSLIKVYGKHTVYSDGGTWYPEACSYLGLKHLLHSPLEKKYHRKNN